MENQLTVFNFKAQEVRTVTMNGEPWWVAKDVCQVLTIDSSNLTKILDEDERGSYTIRTHGGEQEMTVINESGLYSLILRSRKPEAKAFKKWVTSEVLPSIRKTGAYVTPAASDPMIALSMQARNIDQLTAVLSKTLPTLNNEVVLIKQEQTEIVDRLSAVEQKQRDHDAKVIDAYRQALHRCKELLVFGTKGKPQAITWTSFWRELKAVCKVSSFDLRNQAALSVPIMKKAFEYAQEWCVTRGVNPPTLFDFIAPEDAGQDSGSLQKAG